MSLSQKMRLRETTISIVINAQTHMRRMIDEIADKRGRRAGDKTA